MERFFKQTNDVDFLLLLLDAIEGVTVHEHLYKYTV